MAQPYSDFDVLPELAKNSKTLTRLEEYVHYVIEATQYWQESKYMVKNEIRETFSSISSILHQREMQLYQQVDALVNRINYHNAAVDMARTNSSESVNNSLSSDINKIFSSGSYVSPPQKLKFQANSECLGKAIRSLGCVEIQDDRDRVSDDNSFVMVDDSPEDDLNMKVDHISLHGNDLDQIDLQNKMEASSVASSNSSDSFEILSDNKASTSLPSDNNIIKVFVSNLPDGCQSEDLQALFEKHGVVKECFVVRKCGCVLMGTSEEAEQAIKALNNFEFRESCLLVEGVRLTHSGSLDLDSTVTVANGSESLGLLPHSATLNEIPRGQWLKKTDSSTQELSPAAALSKDLASVLSFSSTSKTKAKEAPSLVGCINNANSVVDDLSSHLENTVISDSCQNSATRNRVADTAESGMQNSSVDTPSSSCLPEYPLIIKKMFRSGNNIWLNRGDAGVSVLLSNHKDAKVGAGPIKQKNRLWLDRTVFRKEGSLLVHVNSSEESYCPAFSIKKMFEPYFKNQDKNFWLVKNHRYQKKSVCS